MTISSAARYTPKRSERMSPHKNLFMNIHIMHDYGSQGVGTTQMSID